MLDQNLTKTSIAMLAAFFKDL